MREGTLPALRVRVDPGADGGWRVLCGPGGARLVSGQLSAEQVDEIGRAALRLREGGGGLLVAGRDAERSQRETEVGRALSRVLTASPEVSRALGEALGEARTLGAPLLLAFDIEAPEIRCLPWEVIADGPQGEPLEPQGRAIVALLGPGAREAVYFRPGAAFWSPEPDDPVIAAVRGSVPGAPPPGGGGTLVIAGHGERLERTVALRTPQGEWSASTADHALLPALAAADLVVLAVCDASSPQSADAWPQRVLAAGAPAVVSPTGPVRQEAAAWMLSEVLGAGRRDITAPEAVAAGRRAIRAKAMPMPDARWCRWRLSLGSMEVRRSPRLRILGWPAGDDDASALMDEAVRQAEQAGTGYLGVEHLLLGWSELPRGTPPAQVGFQIHASAERFSAHIARLHPQTSPGLPTALVPTPRIAALGAALPEGFGLEALWNRLLADAAPLLHLLLGRPAPIVRDLAQTATLDPRGVEETRPAACLELLGGPEDGRRLPLAPDDRIGRAGGGVEHELYARTPCTDPHLSRAHLSFLGPGRLVAIKRLHHPQTPAGEEVSLVVGERIAPTSATWLLGLG